MDLPLTSEGIFNGLWEKKFSAKELVESYLKKIAKDNEELNIFLNITDKSALLQAEFLDQKLKNYSDLQELKKDFPLWGCVTAHKDIFLTKGVKTTAGSEILKDFVPEYSSSVVTKLSGAGVITIGKVNCDAWAHGSSGENSDFGPTKNPWNHGFVAGGSSSGSGAAVSANMCTFATSTDTCGSTRLPANFNYAYGLKPTYGAVSRYGIVAMASSLDSPGFIARNASDCRNIFKVIRGEDGKDATVKNSKTKSRSSLAAGKISKVKIGIPKEFFGGGLDTEVEKNIAEAINVFKNSGIEFKEISLPHTKYAISCYYIIQPAEVSSNLARYDGIRYGESRDKFADEAKRRIMLGTYVLSYGYKEAYYNQAMKVRSVLINEVEKVFKKEIDVIIAPVAPTPPFKLDEKTSDPLKMYLTDIFSATANLTGIPALSIPFGFTKNNLPLGFQLMANKFEEDILFDLAEMFEEKSGYRPLTI